MSNIFQEVLTNASGVQAELLGPSYPYWQNIKSPSELNMSSNGNSIDSDIGGLISYAEVLATGDSNASKTGGPLGNKFFLKTGAKCTDVSSNQSVDRYIYVNNVPSGNIPFISSGMGTDFSDARGLIPGVMSDLNVLNPFAILGAFMEGSSPDCQEITMQTIDVNNNGSTQTQFVTTVDIQNMDPCNFGNNGVNPVTGKSCQESFTSRHQRKKKYEKMQCFPKDPFVQVYLAILGILGIYILYCIFKKSTQ
jgi:hypothetical protein